MSPEIFLWIFIALVLFEYFFSTILDYVNDKNWKDEIPEILKNFYDNKNYTKARNYKIERGKISFVSTTISVLITLCFLWFEGFGILSNYIAEDYSSPFAQTAIFFLVLTGICIDYFISDRIDNKILLVIAAVIGGYMALNIGANDVANNMGPAVGGKVLTITTAVIIAAICELQEHY